MSCMRKSVTRSIDWYQKFLISWLSARYSTVFVFYCTQNVKIDFLKFNLLPNEPIESSWDALWLGIRPSPSPPSSSLRLGFLRTNRFFVQGLVFLRGSFFFVFGRGRFWPIQGLVLIFDRFLVVLIVCFDRTQGARKR